MSALKCPWCGALSTFTQRGQWEETLPTATYTWGVWACANTACKRPIVGQVGVDGEPTDWQPRGAVTALEFDDVPESIAQDAAESHLCREVGAHRAAVVMARRAIQSAAVEHGAPDGRPVDQINWLRDQQLITPQMAGLAHHIRTLGGDGAHPPKNVLDEVGDEDSRRALEFLDHFLTFVYMIPARLKRLDPDGTAQAGPDAAPETDVALN
jgi:hypothetical protein